MAVTLCVGLPPATLSVGDIEPQDRVKAAFARGSTRRYTEVLECRHSGQGCRNPASKDGKLWAMTDVPATANMKLRVGMSYE